MDPINFVYWLQGYLELTNDKELDENQVEIIKNHLKLVLEPTFVKAPLEKR